MRRVRGWISLKRVSIIIALVVVLAVVYSLNRAGYELETGFGEYVNSKGEVERGKTLWDWMELLIVPIVLALGGLWFSQQAREAERKAEDRRSQAEREIQERHAQTEREIATDHQREAALQMYFDRMTELLFEKDLLRAWKKDDEVKGIARARTLATLRGLDGLRKGMLVQFLYESDLIKRGAVVDLRMADLSGAGLAWANLREADLKDVHLIEADLFYAKLSGAWLGGANLAKAVLVRADLQEAFLIEANLFEADLTKANLSGAIVTNTELVMAKSLEGATLPNGTIHHGPPSLLAAPHHRPPSPRRRGAGGRDGGGGSDQ